MPTDPRTNPAYILQDDVINEMIPSIGREPWQVVELTKDTTPDSLGLFSALIPPADLATVLSRESWDIMRGDGRPGFSKSYRNGRNITTYRRFGGLAGLRPLVIYRHFHGAWPAYAELSEEFRHFHDLAEDRAGGVLLDFDQSGYPIEVVRIREHSVEVQMRYLLQFIAATRLHLAIFFDIIRYSHLPLESIPESQRLLKHADDRSRYFRHVVRCDFIPEFPTFSRLLGKAIIFPPPVERCGKWPFAKAEPKPEVSFVVGVTPDGTTQEFTSNPAKLSNFFGANPGAPHYLTPVYFRKEVLSKYYADPDRFTVSDGGLGCLSLWSIQIDNNHATHVSVFLGDLGRDLPYDKRLHWKQFNVPPQGRISETNYRRSFLAEFAPPQAPDLIFRSAYQGLNTSWRRVLGWPLFLELGPADAYLLATIRVPVTSSQSEFDKSLSLRSSWLTR